MAIFSQKKKVLFNVICYGEECERVIKMNVAVGAYFILVVYVPIGCTKAD